MFLLFFFAKNLNCYVLFANVLYLLDLLYLSSLNNPANIYLFKVNNRNTGSRYEIC